MINTTVGVRIWNFVNKLQVPLRRQDFVDGSVQLNAPLAVSILARQKKADTGGIDFVDLSTSLLRINLRDKVVEQDIRPGDNEITAKERGMEIEGNTVPFETVINTSNFGARMERLYGNSNDHVVQMDVDVLNRMFNALDQAGRLLLLESIDRTDVLSFFSCTQFSLEANQTVQAFLDKIGY